MRKFFTAFDAFIISLKCQKCWYLMQRFHHIIVDSQLQLKQDKDISKIYNFIFEWGWADTSSYKCGEPLITGEKYLPDCMSAFFINCILKPPVPFMFQLLSSSTDIIILSINLFKSEFLNIPIKCQKPSITRYNSEWLLWAFRFRSKKPDELY